MSTRGWSFTIYLVLLTISLVSMPSCNGQQSVGTQNTEEVFSDLLLIQGAENASATVTRNNETYYTLALSNMEPNDYIAENTRTGWSIAWNRPVDENGSSFDGLKLFATPGEKSWKPVNYLLKIRKYLMSEYHGLTFREIQAAIWTLLDSQEFDLNTLDINQLPNDMVSNGQYNFDREKVDGIVSHVKSNYESFQHDAASPYAVIAEPPSGEATFIAEVNTTVWAYGQHSFRGNELRTETGMQGKGKDQWGWIFELDPGQSFVSTELIAGGNNDDGTKSADETGITVGFLELSHTGEELDLTFKPFSGYRLNDFYLWIGCSTSDFSWVDEEGKVVPHALPDEHITGTADPNNFKVDLSSYHCTDNVYIAAHADEIYQNADIDMTDNSPAEPVFELINLKTEKGFIVAWSINDHGQITGGNHFWGQDEGLTDIGNFFARAINNRGQVAGSSGNHAAIWEKSGGITELGIPDGDRSTAHDINDQGEVVGEIVHEHLVDEDEEYGDVYDYEFAAFIWDEEQESRQISDNGWANGINDQSVVVGIDYSVPQRAFIWSEQDGISDLGSFSGFGSGEAYAINNQKTVAGSVLVSQEPDGDILAANIARDPDQMKKDIDKIMKMTGTKGIYDFGHVLEMIRNSTFQAEAFPWEQDRGLRASVEQIPWDRDSFAQMIRTAQNSNYRSEAFIWNEQEGMISLGTLGGDWSTAWDINDQGQVVGYSSITPGESRAFFWDENHGMIELPTLGGNSLARAINNNGEIVGYSYDSNGEFYPVMWKLKTAR